MNCPVCQRSLAPTLSICPACGAMMNDSVREELESKISSGRLVRDEKNEARATQPKPALPKPAELQAPPAKKTVTANLISHKTSPTLVEFQNKNAMLPDWRIQLQNAVQQRKGGRNDITVTAVSDQEIRPVNHGNLALKTEPTSTPRVETSPQTSDPRVANAVRRIAESRNTFFAEPATPARSAAAVQRTPMRPFGVISPSTGTAVATAPATALPMQKPRLVAPQGFVAEKRSTNKLPQIAEHSEAERVSKKLTPVNRFDGGLLPHEITESKRIHITLEKIGNDEFNAQDVDIDDIEDLAPFSMRFGAGLFDFIISGFATMLMLSPFAFTSDNWFTFTAFLTFVGIWALVSFVYMTACLGLFGKTMGMRLFQLELVDATENEYPTLRQAAVNSSVFLATVAFAGAPFVTVFFNEEKRALHDLVSGTILVREF